jgi:hypothetical protein
MLSLTLHLTLSKAGLDTFDAPLATARDQQANISPDLLADRCVQVQRQSHAAGQCGNLRWQSAPWFSPNVVGDRCDSLLIRPNVLTDGRDAHRRTVGVRNLVGKGFNPHPPDDVLIFATLEPIQI